MQSLSAARGLADRGYVRGHPGKGITRNRRTDL
jgi:hypothetical protein